MCGFARAVLRDHRRGPERRRGHRLRTTLVASVTLAAALTAGDLTYGPYRQVSGGGSTPVGAMMVGDATNPSFAEERGNIDFVWVTVTDRSWLEAGMHAVAAGTPGVAASADRLEMLIAESNAIAVAHSLLDGTDFPLALELTSSSRRARAWGLRRGDKIVAVDGLRVGGLVDLVAVLSDGRPHALWVDRGGEMQIVEIPPHPPSRVAPAAELTVTRVNSRLRILTPPDYGGPSAGLMFSLAMLDALAPGQLSGGARIAGTGTVDPLGDVGEVGDVRLKLAVAAAAGAKVFFVPAQQAVGLPRYKGLTVVPAGTVGQALHWLCTHGGWGRACAPSVIGATP